MNRGVSEKKCVKKVQGYLFRTVLQYKTLGATAGKRKQENFYKTSATLIKRNQGAYVGENGFSVSHPLRKDVLQQPTVTVKKHGGEAEMKLPACESSRS